jgi:2-isopropylmalate synthase
MHEFDIKRAVLGVVYEPKGRFYTCKWNLLDEVKAELNLPKRVELLDTTIREGGEAPWVAFSLEQKLKIAKELAEIGVSELDCGFVSLSKAHFDTLRAIKDAGLKVRTMGIARVDVTNPEAVIDMTIDAGADVVELAMYGVPIPGFATEQDYVSLIEDSARYTKKRGALCAFWVPGNRWEPDFAENLYRAAIRGGADRVDIAGTNCVGLTAFKMMTKRFKEIAGDRQVGVHCHNQYGTGTACALVGVEAGADVVHTAVNGMSHTGGLASLDEVVIALTAQYGLNLGIKLERLKGLSDMVREFSRLPLSPWKPMVGDSAFEDTPDSHLERIISGRGQKEAERAEWSAVGVKPEFIGQKIKLVFGPAALGGEPLGLKQK